MYLLTLWFLVFRPQQKGGIHYCMVIVATLLFIISTAVSPPAQHVLLLSMLMSSC